MRSSERVLTWALPTFLICTLAALASLQYRWSSEISEAASTRMRSTLQNSTMSFRQDLAGQLGTLCLDLQSEAGGLPVDGKHIARGLALWKQTSSYPEMPAEIYVWNVSDRNVLLRLSLPEAHFERIKWPSSLADLRDVLTNAAAADTDSSHQDPSRMPDAVRGRPQVGGIDEAAFTVMVPAVAGSPSSWLLVQLNQNVLQQRVFPDLAARYFGDPRNSDYEVAIVRISASGTEPIYSTDSGGATEADSSPDASLNLFGPPMTRGPSPPSAGPFRPSQALGSSLDRNAAASPGISFPVRFDPIHAGMGEQNWQIVAKHRKGSVEAAVGALRRRNLALSFFVLLTMAGAVGLIILNSYRARRLAHIQMDFIAGVSHELRTPVASILSISDNMAAGVASDPAKLAKYGDVIRSQARQLNHLVEQVLRFSTLQKIGKLTVRSFSLPEVIEDTLESTAPLIASSNMDLRCQIEPGLPQVSGDPIALSQCLKNLITNAIKYRGENNLIAIEVRIADSDSKRVEIAVADEGIGISPEDVGQVFRPFYRSPRVIESPIHGTGLGLALTKGYIESMGGEISVVSHPGKGSTFKITLLAANGTSAQVPEQAGDSA